MLIRSSVARFCLTFSCETYCADLSSIFFSYSGLFCTNFCFAQCPKIPSNLRAIILAHQITVSRNANSYIVYMAVFVLCCDYFGRFVLLYKRCSSSIAFSNRFDWHSALSIVKVRHDRTDNFRNSNQLYLRHAGETLQNNHSFISWGEVAEQP